MASRPVRPMSEDERRAFVSCLVGCAGGVLIGSALTLVILWFL